MINSITVDLTPFYERQPWGIIYHDYETEAVIDSDYCDDIEDCLSSLNEHRNNFHYVCTVDFILPDTPYDVDHIVEEIACHFDELGIAGWGCRIEN